MNLITNQHSENADFKSFSGTPLFTTPSSSKNPRQRPVSPSLFQPARLGQRGPALAGEEGRRTGGWRDISGVSRPPRRAEVAFSGYGSAIPRLPSRCRLGGTRLSRPAAAQPSGRAVWGGSRAQRGAWGAAGANGRARAPLPARPF